MTGIERLRELAELRMVENRESVTLRAELRSIADQIDREQDEHARCQLADYLRVRAVERDMERHVLGHEGMEDSPVARWARELRASLGGRDEEVTDVATIRKDAYDAYEWVSKYGGLEKIKLDAACWNTAENIAQTTLDWLARVCPVAGIEKCGYGVSLEKLEDAINRRLMPEGMEWPRYDTGEPVPLGGEVEVTVHDEDGDFDRTLAIRSIKYKENGVLLEGTKNEMVILSHGERVKRPDSWERLEDDCAKSDVDYCAERGLLDPSCDTVEGEGSTRHCTDCGCTCGEKMARDLVRRTKALAERDA